MLFPFLLFFLSLGAHFTPPFTQFGISVLLVLLLDAVSAREAKRIRIVSERKPDQDIPIYGNWCGPGHGGFSDCCNGNACPGCPTPPEGDFSYSMNASCLEECPPIDELDRACAWHDTCSSISGSSSECTYDKDGQQCFCNCVLTAVACQPNMPFAGVCGYFNSVACWYCDSGIGKCDGYSGPIDQPLSYFCKNGANQVRFWNGTIAIEDATNYPVCDRPPLIFETPKLKIKQYLLYFQNKIRVRMLLSSASICFLTSLPACLSTSQMR